MSLIFVLKLFFISLNDFINLTLPQQWFVSITLTTKEGMSCKSTTVTAAVSSTISYLIDSFSTISTGLVLGRKKR